MEDLKIGKFYIFEDCYSKNQLTFIRYSTIGLYKETWSGALANRFVNKSLRSRKIKKLNAKSV